MTREQQEAYRQFCYAFNLSIHTLSVAFIVADNAFNSISYGRDAAKEYGTVAKEEIRAVANLMK